MTGHRAAHAAARVHAGAHPVRRVHADRALVDAGDAGRGLRADRPREGLPQRRIVVSHALRNAMLPIVTLVALSLGFIVAGAILVEIIFSWPGIGQAMYAAVAKRDYPMLQGAFLDPHGVGRVLQLHRRPHLLQAGPEDDRMKTVDPALAEDTALEARPSKGGSPVLQVLRERRSALLGLFIVGFFVAMAIFGPAWPRTARRGNRAPCTPRPRRSIGSAPTTAGSTCSAR